MRRFAVMLALPLVAAFLLAAVAPAAADAAKGKRAKAVKPKITLVAPMRVGIGQTLVIRGRNFRIGGKRNTVIFRHAKTRRLAFAKPRSASKRKLVVKVPVSVMRLLARRQDPTRLQLRVVSARRVSNFTARRLSPVVVGRGAPNGNDRAAPACNDGPDHDGDLLPNALELAIGTNPCLADTDGDGVEDGFEYKSAVDLNDDEYQDPNSSLPYPGKRPYPNPLNGDADVDYDGDSLTLEEEHRLWRYAIREGRAARTLHPLYYSDGLQYSIHDRGSDNRRRPALVAAGYERQESFLAWAAANGYRTIALGDHDAPWWDTRTLYDLLDFNRDGVESAVVLPGYAHSESLYYDLLPDGYLSDDERDEDADGLTNFDESHGRAMSGYWDACYSGEVPFGIKYASTEMTDPDSVGDGIRDGADDQDHDDVPNIMELSRLAASGLWDGEQQCKARDGLPSPPDTNHPDAYGRVNPFNPCLPAHLSRTCTMHPGFAGAAAPYDGSLNWVSLN